jgi:hypothetical protein
MLKFKGQILTSGLADLPGIFARAQHQGRIT